MLHFLKKAFSRNFCIRLKRNALLVSFAGVDGSGKTTHAKSLVSYLTEKGYDCVYTWSGYRPILSYPFLAITRILGYWRKHKKDAFTDPLRFAPEKLRNGILGLLWRCLVFADFQIKIFATIGIQLILGKIVVCDRYLHDLVMELMVSGLYSNGFGKLLECTTPKPQISFLMDVPVNVARKRRTPPLDTLLEKKKAYLNLIHFFNLIVVDGSGDFARNQLKIRREVISRLAGLR